jgi:hypothetical protein
LMTAFIGRETNDDSQSTLGPSRNPRS